MKVGLVDSGIGIIPFIKEILKKDIRNDYYLYFDRDSFPYGNKDFLYLENRLKEIIKFYEKYDVEEILICCNTLSYIYLKSNINTKIKIKTILEINLTKNKRLLTTEFLSKQISSISGENLASEIEKNNIQEIIKIIKKLRETEVVLSCTHYPLIKSIFYIYNINALSYENLLLKGLPSHKEMNFYIKERDEEILKKYFKKLSIKYIDL